MKAHLTADTARSPRAAAVAPALVLCTGFCAVEFARAADVQVIYSEKDGHPTSVVPGARDLAGMPVLTEFKAMEDFSMSPDGSQWALKSRNELGSDLEAQVLVGSGLTGNMFMQEGQPFQGAGDPTILYDFFDTTPGPVSWNESGVMAFSARSKGGPTAVDEKIVIFEAGVHTIVLQEGDPVTGLIDNPPANSGDEILGSSLGPVFGYNDGDIGYVSNPIGNCSSTRYPAIFRNDVGDVQSGVSMIEGETWDTIGLGDWRTTPDGLNRLIEGETEEAASTSDRIVAVDDAIVIREGSPVAGSAVTCTDIFHCKMTSNGHWYCRGDDPANNDWAVAGDARAAGPGPSYALVAASGDPVDDSGSGETWLDIFSAFAGNNGGHWVLAGNTSNPDPAVDSVISLNGQRVVVREGDPIDLDGNGFFDDDAFIGRGDNTLSAFAANDIELTDDMWLYFIAPLHDAAGNDLGTFGAGGEAFMRLDVSCPADIAGPAGNGTPDGNVDALDYLLLIAQWGSPGNCPPGPPCAADITGPDGGPDGNVDSLDFLLLISQWGSPGNCPTP